MYLESLLLSTPGQPHSLDLRLEDNVPLDELGAEQEPSAENSLLDQVDAIERAQQKTRLITILSDLDNEEKQLIQSLFFDGISAREYARQMGVQLRTVQYRRDKLLDKLRQKIFS